MKTSLDLTKLIETSNAVPDRTLQSVFMHLVEEVGEVSVCINRPHKATEPLLGEIGDVLTCALDLYLRAYGNDLGPLNDSINEKCAKWLRVAIAEA